MNKTLSGIALAYMLLTGVQGSAKESINNTGLRLSIHIYDYAVLDQTTLAQSEQVAKEVLQKIGVETVWNTNPLVKPEGGPLSDETNCGLAHITLGILPREMADRFAIPSTSLGLAPGTGSNRNQLYVFANRASELVKLHFRAFLDKQSSYRASFPEILGYAMAHELAHLLGLEKHSRKGIMLANWNVRTLEQVASRGLRFSTDEAATIRKEVRRRMLSEHAASPHTIAMADASRC